MIDNRGYLYPERKENGYENLETPITVNCCGSKCRFTREDAQKDGRIISFYTSTTVPGITCFPMDGGP